jgi:hypothetical protein
VLIGAATVGVYAYQARIMVAALLVSNRSADAAKASAEAAKTAADIAAQTLKDSTTSFKLQQRPYVLLSALDLDGKLRPELMKITVTLKNSGRTPGLGLIVDLSAFINNKMLRRVSDIPKGGHTSRQNIGDQAFTLTGPFALDNDAFRGIVEGRDTLYIKGSVLYSDIFGDTHRTVYCVFYNTFTTDFAYCDHGNDVQ